MKRNLRKKVKHADTTVNQVHSNGNNHNGIVNDSSQDTDIVFGQLELKNKDLLEGCETPSTFTEGGHIYEEEGTERDLSLDSLLGSLGDKGRYSRTNSVRSGSSKALSIIEELSIKNGVVGNVENYDFENYDLNKDFNILEEVAVGCSTRRNSIDMKKEEDSKNKDKSMNLSNLFFAAEKKVRANTYLEVFGPDNDIFEVKKEIDIINKQENQEDEALNSSFGSLEISTNQQKSDVNNQPIAKNTRLSRRIKQETEEKKANSNNTSVNSINANKRPTDIENTYGTKNKKGKNRVKVEKNIEEEIEKKVELFKEIDEFELPEETI
ncbi:hypothetical protein K502DRAFT_343827 [Neoconidiobolus thromboides FSU 785]|nr:hypothetical protein K502DRAFT_343827 [Neoconidiobolus thromboides FSU 785]